MADLSRSPVPFARHESLDHETRVTATALGSAAQAGDWDHVRELAEGLLRVDAERRVAESLRARPRPARRPGP